MCGILRIWITTLAKGNMTLQVDVFPLIKSMIIKYILCLLGVPAGVMVQVIEENVSYGSISTIIMIPLLFMAKLLNKYVR